MKRVVLKSFAVALLLSLAVPRPAMAYIDPNTGGILIQALATGFAVLSGVALIFSRQIRAGIARARRYIRERRGAGEDTEGNVTVAAEEKH
jgi:hypothetical protein